MELSDASNALATLGHPGRLSVFRLLMRFAPHGVRPTEIASALGLKPNTLSHHLAGLVASGLVGVTRQGRSLYYAVDLGTAEALIGYLALDVGRARPDLLSPLCAARRTGPGDGAPFNVLFICSRNSARSIMAEALLRDLGQGRFRAHSAGTRPTAAPNPLALDVLTHQGHDIAGLQAKHVSGFQRPGAAAMDFVFTVCDLSAAEDCPPWHGHPMMGHWGVSDPAGATGDRAQKAQAFARTYGALRRRIMAFVALPFERLSRISLQSRVDSIGTENDIGKRV